MTPSLRVALVAGALLVPNVLAWPARAVAPPPGDPRALADLESAAAPNQPHAADGQAAAEPSADGRADGRDRRDGRQTKTSRCFGGRATLRANGGAPVPLTAGDDTVVGDGKENEIGDSPGFDRVCGGGGNDRIDAREPGPEPDGRRLFARGGDGDDTLLGTDGDDRLLGEDGDDSLGGFGGRNELFGGRGDDFLASSGPDRMDGGPGNDRLNADDQTAVDVDADVVLGGKGDDLIFAVDDLFDLIDCGPGEDAVEFDAGLDQVDASCEDLTPVP